MTIDTSDLDASAIKIKETKEVYKGYAKVNQLTFTHPKFDGSRSEPIAREIFISGDAVVVLPFDANLQTVCLIEQIRMAPLVNGDHPWLIEAIAGRIDKETTAREIALQEAHEEAGCILTDLVEIGTFYQSPGIFAERITYFIGAADLSQVGGVHGLDVENEDIRAFCVPLDTALSAINEAQITSALTTLGLLALKDRREALTRLWRS
jgi:ADP-ribose pyrophosphatase